MMVAACGGTVEPEPQETEDDLTSLTARSRELRFESVVYVEVDASEREIVSAAQEQTRTAFGALQHEEIAVNDRELRTIDPATFVKREVNLVDGPDDPNPWPMLEVRYTYIDKAVVPTSMARRSSIPSAVLAQGTHFKSDQVIRECTANTSHSRDYPNWYEFDPSLASCKGAIASEQRRIDEAQGALGRTVDAPLTKRLLERVYIPITVKLGPDQTNKRESYPEYQRLFAGGVEQDKLVLGLMYGLIDDDPATPADDFNFGEWMTHLKYIFDTRPGFKLVSADPAVDTRPVRLSNGTEVSDLSFENLMQWHQGRGFPSGLGYSQQRELKNEVSKRYYQRFLSFEAPVTVSEAGKDDRPFTIKVLTYFGVESDPRPHKRAIKNSDVYFYNGHSYVGSGPLDPDNFSAADFPSSYQLLFIDGCVSYNYYEKDYFPLKQGGTQNLDIITNGLETPAYQGGSALGKFTAALIDGSFPSYRKLLEKASATDSLRVVDGELDNEYKPSKFKLSLK